VQRLQHDHRRDHVRRQRRAATARGKQILEHLRRKQPLPVPSQEHEHAARLKQMTSNGLHIQQLTLNPRTTLHEPNAPKPEPTVHAGAALFSSLLGLVENVGVAAKYRSEAKNVVG